ncbi:MAG: cupin domain-containing protein, partial [Chloroflexi bacterium]|nr:cupin domain-containing protein [Chloroflexota bacterium]
FLVPALGIMMLILVSCGGESEIGAVSDSGNDGAVSYGSTVIETSRVLTFADFEAAGVKHSKDYNTEGLPGAIGASLGFYNTRDIEFRFFPSHEIAVREGIPVAHEIVGPDVYIKRENVTWTWAAADQKAFSACPSDSIDYAVMEHLVPAAESESGEGNSIGCVVVPLNAGWSDVGSWSAVWDEGKKDEAGNVVSGDVYLHGITNSVIMGQSRLVTAVGLNDVIVVETPDAILVAHKDRVEEVREIVLRLQDDGRPEEENHRKVHRPWGTYEVVDSGHRFQTKRLTVKPGAALSLQMHHHRAEHWVVVSGTATVTRGDEVYILTENESTYVPVGVKHRLENCGTIPLEIIEVQSGSYLGEDDIVRFEDRYNRQD